MNGQNWTRFGIVGLGTLVGPLDSAVNISFPDITQAFGLPLESIQWVIICYVVTYASLMLVFGRLGDQLGHHRVFQAGLAVCAVGFALCGSAETYEGLLVWRVVQGVGTAMVISCGPALVTSLFDESHRARILGAYTMVFGLGGAVGPTLGGILVDIWGWPSVFWFRLPIALVVLALSFVFSMPPRTRAGGGFDAVGAVLLATGMSLFLVTVNQAWRGDLPLGIVIAFAVGTVVTIAGFIWQQGRVEAPIINLAVFRDIDFSLIILTGIAVNFTGFSVMLLVPYFLVRATDLPLWFSGIVLACGPAGMIIAAQIGGILAQRVGANRLGFLGVAFNILGIGAVGFWDVNAAAAVMIAAMLVHGMGLGFFQVASLEIVTATLPIANRGVAGSLVLLTRTIGVVLSASLLTLLFVSLESQAAAAGAANSFLAAFQTTFRYTAGFMLLFLAATCLRPRLWFRHRQEPG